jgi:hypothetical protein
MAPSEAEGGTKPLNKRFHALNQAIVQLASLIWVVMA